MVSIKRKDKNYDCNIAKRPSQPIKCRHQNYVISMHVKTVFLFVFWTCHRSLLGINQASTCSYICFTIVFGLLTQSIYSTMFLKPFYNLKNYNFLISLIIQSPTNKNQVQKTNPSCPVLKNGLVPLLISSSDRVN